MTPADHVHQRAEYLRVTAVRSEGGGWDVVLRIDGSYTIRQDAEDMAAALREWLDRPAGAVWWDGPPWKRQEAA